MVLSRKYIGTWMGFFCVMLKSVMTLYWHCDWTFLCNTRKCDNNILALGEGVTNLYGLKSFSMDWPVTAEKFAFV